jgi:hypothetical protein
MRKTEGKLTRGLEEGELGSLLHGSRRRLHDERDEDFQSRAGVASIIKEHFKHTGIWMSPGAYGTNAVLAVALRMARATLGKQ